MTLCSFENKSKFNHKAYNNVENKLVLSCRITLFTQIYTAILHKIEKIIKIIFHIFESLKMNCIYRLAFIHIYMLRTVDHFCCVEQSSSLIVRTKQSKTIRKKKICKIFAQIVQQPSPAADVMEINWCFYFELIKWHRMPRLVIYN